MIVSKSSCVYLERDFLLKNKYLCFEFILENDKATLISGTLLDPYNKPLPNACIEIFEETFVKEKIFIGRTFTNSNGDYGFTLDVKESSYYSFYVYAPL